MKVYLYFMLVMVSVLGLQSCGSEIDGEWVCTEAKADGNIYMSRTAEKLLNTNVGTIMRIDGDEVFTTNKVNGIKMYNKGKVELSEDKKTLKITYTEVANEKMPWIKLKKEMIITRTREVETLTDKKMVLHNMPQDCSTPIILTYKKN